MSEPTPVTHTAPVTTATSEQQATSVASAGEDEKKQKSGHVYATKEEAKAVFMQLLRDKNVQPIWNWDKV